MLVSIYVPTKNRVALLKEAVASVQRQSYANWELVIVNDGSTDETAEYLAAVSAQDSRIRYINMPASVGGCRARNAAIQAARGDMVTGLDDDDTFGPGRLQAFVSAWQALAGEKKPVSCLYSQISEVQHGRVVGVTSKPASCDLEDMFTANVVGSQIFAPRQFYLDAGLFNPEMPAWQDMEFYMRLLKRFGTARLVDEGNYFFENTPRVDRVSTKSQQNIRRAFELVNALHAEGLGRRTQRLYLQLFVRVYDIQPSLADVLAFVRLGWWPEGWVRLLKAFVRNRLPRR
ncbi:glycosyltransferase family 2 protein [Aquabacterium sp.]|uniref:glycosyltransferase family 2 protein n=1 Tax=Aquabacterium sp. TaxID=1872578 RepID=UPI0025C56ED9|nr:glycosyltransferase family 2 protein [Aquabacterium sp.]